VDDFHSKYRRVKAAGHGKQRAGRFPETDRGMKDSLIRRKIPC
jgi:hypothetical protein